jgi:hypothetical protein
VKLQHTFIAPTRRGAVDSSSKIPDTIIREPTAADPGTCIERNARLAFSYDYSAMQKKSANCRIIFSFYLTVAYIYCTPVLVGPTDKMPLIAYLPPSDRYD